MSRRYDTVIFDLDGTLLTTDKILTERTKKALEAFWKTGADIG